MACLMKLLLPQLTTADAHNVEKLLANAAGDVNYDHYKLQKGFEKLNGN